MTLLLLLLLPLLISGQCNDQLPSGKDCGADDFFAEADPNACSMFYDCVEGCVEHKQCEPLEDGLPRVFDEVYEWCSYRDSTDCGSRPCQDATACATQPPKTSTTTLPDCGTVLDCKDLGDGYHPDPYNCRKYWHCYKGEGEHEICPDDPDTGVPEVWDLTYSGCNFQDTTDCGDRPICDECDKNCVDGPTSPPECGHVMDCTDMQDGWYPDEWNCRKYWHCSAGHGQHFMCDKQLQYNPEAVQCDFDDRVDCGDRPICNECDGDCHDDETGGGGGGDANCGPDNHHPSDICEGRADGWYPDNFNCAKYWHCSAEKGEHFMCATGLVYESSKVQCDWPDRVNCEGRPACDNCDENCS